MSQGACHCGRMKRCERLAGLIPFHLFHFRPVKMQHSPCQKNGPRGPILEAESIPLPDTRPAVALTVVFQSSELAEDRSLLFTKRPASGILQSQGDGPAQSLPQTASSSQEGRCGPSPSLLQTRDGTSGASLPFPGLQCPYQSTAVVLDLPNSVTH